MHLTDKSEDCIDKRFIRINERIRAREIRVIDDESNQLGIMPPFEALKIARERNLDLVEVSPTAQPPVCRIMDYGKYLYQQEKREREAKKHQHQITVKEVKFRINVDDHDYDTKKNHVLRFLGEGDKVKATIFFRGREMTRQGLGRTILDRLIKDLGDKAIVEFRPRQEGNTLHLILAPPKEQKPPANPRSTKRALTRAPLRTAPQRKRRFRLSNSSKSVVWPVSRHFLTTTVRLISDADYPTIHSFCVVMEKPLCPS